MATHFFTMTADSSGVASTTVELHGQLAAIRVTKTLAGNPAVTIKELQGIQQTVLSAVTVTAATIYYPRKEVQDNSGSALVYASTDGVADRYMLDGQIQISCTSATENAVISGFIQVY